MIETVTTVAKHAADRPLVALALVLFVGVPLVLGWVHEARILVDCSIPLIRHVKHEYREWKRTIEEVRKELRAPESESASKTGPRRG
ncbi:MAG TPA: hypothetical protein VGF48_05830 [Thermoanaerobaculia bacterium]|jgi:hypothetical protein